MINRRQKWTGHLWQGKFSLFPMDEAYLLAAAQYIEMNPVRAGLTPDPYAWKWSSAKAHADGTDVILVPYSRKPFTQFSPPQSVGIKKNTPLWGVRIGFLSRIA
jgi:hypothetical protein